MNKFDVLLSLLAKVQEEYIGTEIDDMGGYSNRASVTLKLRDGSMLSIEVTYKEAEQEGENEQ